MKVLEKEKMELKSKQLTVIGERMPSKDGMQIVTGKAKYIDDIFIPNMLYGKILRAHYPHARIVNIDTSKAERLTGVKAVITAEDTPKLRYGIPYIYDEVRDEPVLADDKVRFYGDRVAAVAAVDMDTAEEALDLIEVEYEELPAVFDPEEAMQDHAPLIHDAPYNIAAHKKVYAGDVEKGFAESDLVLEGKYRAQPQEHAHMEPHGAIATCDLSGRIHVITTTQTPFTIRRDLEKMLAIPLRYINVEASMVGGGFGGKNEVTVEPHCVLLSKKSGGYPVKMVYSREEEFIASTIRHPVITYSKIGVSKDGFIKAKQARVIIDNGAYSNHGIGVCYYMGTIFASLYKVENVKYDGFLVYTNQTYGGAFRGYGNPQITFAIETEMDKIAEKLNMDSMELRLKNAPVEGERSASGINLYSCGLRECIISAAEKVDWKKKKA